MVRQAHHDSVTLSLSKGALLTIALWTIALLTFELAAGRLRRLAEESGGAACGDGGDISSDRHDELRINGMPLSHFLYYIVVLF